MESRAAAKGRKLLFLAAVCLASALLLSPTAEASRGLSAGALNLELPAPRWDAEAPPAPRLDLFHLEDELLLKLLTGVEPEHHQALLEHRRLELLSAAAIQKTASGVSTSDFQLNVKKGKSLKPDLRWTVPFYAKARFYDPEVGRFLTEDPAEPDLTTPPSLHKYLYAYGNPTVYVDPDGRISLLSDLSAALGDSKEGLIAAAGANTPDESTGFFARGWKQFHTATLGMRAGVAGIAQGGVDLLNLGVNASLVNQKATMGLSFGTLTDEATAEFLTGASSLIETAEIIRENPKAVAATVYNNAKEVVKAAAAGDHEAQARVQALVTEIAVDIAIGSKGLKSAAGIGVKTTDTIVDTSLDLAKRARRTADLVNDVDGPSVRLPKPKPKPQQPRAIVPENGGQTAIRERVMANIARSQAVRDKSNFGDHILRESAPGLLEGLTYTTASRAGRNPAWARGLLSRAELDATLANPRRLTPPSFGKVVERGVAQDVQSSPILRSWFRHVGGPGNPDFVGIGPMRGMRFEITTDNPWTLAEHLARPYGPGLNIATYSRPWGFRF